MKRNYFGDNLYHDIAFDEAPPPDDDEDAIRAGMDAFLAAYKAARDKRRAKDGNPDHRKDFNPKNFDPVDGMPTRDAALDHAVRMALDSARGMPDFDSMFGVGRHPYRTHDG